MLSMSLAKDDVNDKDGLSLCPFFYLHIHSSWHVTPLACDAIEIPFMYYIRSPHCTAVLAAPGAWHADRQSHPPTLTLSDDLLPVVQGARLLQHRLHRVTVAGLICPARRPLQP